MYLYLEATRISTSQTLKEKTVTVIEVWIFVDNIQHSSKKCFTEALIGYSNCKYSLLFISMQNELPSHRITSHALSPICQKLKKVYRAAIQLCALY